MNTHVYKMICLLALLLVACTTQAPSPAATLVPEPTPKPTATPVPPTPAPIERDYWPTAGWHTSTPEEQGIDSQKLAELMDYLLEQQGIDIDSLLIVRNGYLVMDAYFYPFAEGMLHDLASATKSFTSSLIGIAIEQGAIEGVDELVLDLFPGRTVANLDSNKEAMMLEDLLAMRSGLRCQGESATREMMASQDWTQFALDQPMNTKPGSSYNYCGLNSHLLSAIIQETTGMSALAYLGQNLRRPLGIPNVIWPSDPQGNSWGWGDLKMTPHDMAKFGYLFLNRGQWDGQQVVSEAWVNAATSGQSYGYQWWLKPSGIFYACGVGGQEIWVVPDDDLVVVMTGATGGGCAGAWGDQLMNSHILPLVESAKALPPNPDGVAALDSKILAVAEPVESQSKPLPAMPEIAQRVSEKMYLLESNPIGLQSLSIAFPEEAEAVLSLIFVDDTKIQWRIGLDDVLRFSPGLHGLTSGAKGWWEKENVFTVHREEIGDSRPQEELISAIFEEDQVTLQIQASDGDLTIIGRLEE